MSTKSAFLSVRAVAELLGVPDRTVRHWCSVGKFATVRPGHAILITRASVEALIQPATTAAA